MGYIYSLCNKINQKIYIGQTRRPIQERFKEHRTGKSNSCRAIYNAIKFHGWDNFEKEWYECPDEDLDFDEELLVKEMKTLSPDGYNLKEGGSSCGKHSDESKQRMSEVKRGEKHNNFGKTHTDESKKRMSEAKRGEKHNMYGKSRSEKTKQKISDSTKGENNHKSKRVYQYDLDENLIGSFGSVGEAAKYVEGYRTNIARCARGKLKTAYGFKWSYNPPSN